MTSFERDDQPTGPERDHLSDLVILNRELDRLGIPPLISTEVAEITPPAELDRVVKVTRHYLLDRAASLGEVV